MTNEFRAMFTGATTRGRGLRTLASAVLILAALGTSRPAAAVNARIEGAAKTALTKAAQEFNGGKADAAMTRLQNALAACAIDKCTSGTKAALMRDSAAIEIKRGNREAGVNALVAAFRVDPTIERNDKYDVPALASEWTAAKDEAAASKGPQPSGDFSHTPAAEQAVQTPLPVFVEYSGSSALTRVTIKYKGTGMSEFKLLTLTKKSGGWAATIPCGDVKRGGVRYYIEGFDSGGDIVARSGSPTEPFGVPIRTKISGSAPSLPGASPPKACADGASDASSDTPSKGAVGAACNEKSECDSNVCHEGFCGEPVKKEERPGEYSRIWIGIAGALDFLKLPSASDVCRRQGSGPSIGTALNGAYYCTNDDGSNFPNGKDENATIAANRSGIANGGYNPGNIRLMLTVDFAVSSNFLLGARLGIVLNHYPGTDAVTLGHGLHAPIHLEARLTYVFGDAPLATAGFAPYIMAGAGISEFDGSTTVTVTQNAPLGDSTKTAWITAGPWFIEGGGGIRYAFTPQAAALLGLRVAGTPAALGFMPVLAPELQIAYGF